MEQQVLSLSNSFKNYLQPKQIGSYDTKVIGEFDETTLKLFGALQGAYNFFRENLFENKLSPVVLTLNRNAKSSGYFLHSAWINESKIVLPEINISPSILRLEPIIVMSILVHEMSHHFQHLHGNPGREKYHNREFAKIMFELGLMCSDTGKPGGKPTGDHMSHYVLRGGRFEQAFIKIPKEYIIPFKSFSFSNTATITRSAKDKAKYCCDECQINLWGKSGLYIICGKCKNEFTEVKQPSII